jgi:hypothetical protein
MGIGNCRAGGMQRQVRGHFARRRDMPLADTSALHNPLIGRLHRLGQFIVG